MVHISEAIENVMSEIKQALPISLDRRESEALTAYMDMLAVRRPYFEALATAYGERAVEMQTLPNQQTPAIRKLGDAYHEMHARWRKAMMSIKVCIPSETATACRHCGGKGCMWCGYSGEGQGW